MLEHLISFIYTAIFIEFLGEFGDLPLMKVDATYLDGLDGGTFVEISEYQQGTKEDVECSQLGICNPKTGQCTCVEGYGSSNGTVYGQGER